MGAREFDQECDGEEARRDYVNHPYHYTQGPIIGGRMIEAIEVIRYIRDARLANAVRYIWRVSWAGKWNSHEDIQKAIWYLTDYLEHPIDES